MHRPRLHLRRTAFVEFLYGNLTALIILALLGLINPHWIQQTSLADLVRSAFAKEKIHDWDGAITDFTAALKLKPDSGYIYLGRGGAKLSKQDFPGAVADFTRAIEFDAHTATAYYCRAAAREYTSDRTGALADCDTALAIDPTLHTVLNSRGLLKRKMGDSNGALADANAAILLAPDNYLYFFNRSLIHDRRREYSQALADYTRASELKPDDAIILNNLAWMYATSPGLAETDRPKALPYATKACTITHWKKAGHIDTLAAAYAAIGQYDEAIKWQTKYVAMAPKDPNGKTRLDLYQQHRPYLEAL